MSRLPTSDELLRTRELAQADRERRRDRALGLERELLEAGRECWEMIGDFVTRARELGVNPTTWQSPERGGQGSTIVWVEGYPLTNGAIATAPPLRYCVSVPRHLRRPELVPSEVEELALFTVPVGDTAGAAAPVREHQSVSGGNWPRIDRLEHMYAFQHVLRRELESSLQAFELAGEDGSSHEASDPPSPAGPPATEPFKPADFDADESTNMSELEATSEARVSGQSRVSGGRWVRGAAPESSLESEREGAPVTVTTEPGPPRPSLGRLLVEAGVASEQQVKFAIAEGLGTGEKLGEVLVRRGWATDELLAKLLAEQWQLPFATGAELSVDPSATTLIARTEARELGALPIGFDGDRVVVAITEPTKDLLDLVAERFEHPSCIVVARADFHSLLEERSPDSGTAADVEVPEAVAPQVDETALPAQTDSHAPASDGAATNVRVPASALAGTLAGSTLSSLEAAMDELQRIHQEVAAIGKSLQLARDQLAEANADLEAAQEAREHDAGTIHRLESERTERAEHFETLKTQVAALHETLVGHQER